MTGVTNLKLSDVYSPFGYNWSAVARALSISRAAICRWVENGGIPMRSQEKLEELTNKKLVADYKDDPTKQKALKSIVSKQKRIFTNDPKNT